MLIFLKCVELGDANCTMTSIIKSTRDCRKQRQISRFVVQRTTSEFFGWKKSRLSLGAFVLPASGLYFVSWGHKQSHLSQWREKERDNLRGQFWAGTWAGTIIDVLNRVVMIGINLSLLDGSSVFLHVRPLSRATELLPKPGIQQQCSSSEHLITFQN